MNRRQVLQLLVAAPLAAVVPPACRRAEVFQVWQPLPHLPELELVEWQRQLLYRMINPPIVAYVRPLDDVDVRPGALKYVGDGEASRVIRWP